MAYDFSKFKEKVKATTDWLSSEFLSLRTGRVSPNLLDSIVVESYGSRMPVAHVAAISIEDARTLRVAPWDKSQIKDIEKAIAAANLGVGIFADGAGVRLSFPELTEDRRKTLLKVVKTKLEESRVAIRHERDVVWGDIQTKEKASEITEDEKFRYKEELQKLVDEATNKLDMVAVKKEEEIMG